MPRRAHLLAVCAALALVLAALPGAHAVAPTLSPRAPLPRGWQTRLTMASTTTAANAVLPMASAQTMSPPTMLTSLTDLQHGLDAQRALETYFGQGNGYYLETYPAGRSDSYMAWLWSYTRAMAASESLDMLLGGAEGDVAQQDVPVWLVGLSHYWVAHRAAYNASVRPPVGINANTYYDDNDWAGLDLVAAYDATGDQSALDQAETVFNAYVIHGWANGAVCGGLSGGIYWVATGAHAFSERTTTATGGAALLALELYARTGNPDYLTWGQRLYDWVNAHLRDPSDGLYWDHISPGANGCVIDKDKVSYDQAMMIGATFLLGQLLPIANPTIHSYPLQRQIYTARAEQMAQAALDHYDGQYDGMSAPYNGIFFQTLGKLYPAAGNDPRLQRDIVRAMRSYTSWAYTTVRDPQTGVYWFPHPEGAAFLIDQAAMVQIYATLAQCEQWQAPLYTTYPGHAPA